MFVVLVHCISYSPNWIIGSTTLIGGYIIWIIFILCYFIGTSAASLLVTLSNFSLGVCVVPFLLYWMEKRNRHSFFLQWCSLKELKRWQKVLNNLPVGVLIYKRSALTFASLTARRLLIGSNEATTEYLSKAISMNEQLRVALGTMDSTCQNETVLHMNNNGLEQQVSQVQLIGSNGQLMPLGLSMITLGLQDELYKVCIMQDQSLYAELEKEKTGKQYMKNFFSMIAHELRNPLHGVLGMFEAMSNCRGSRDDEEIHIQCCMGINTVKLMMLLVNDMLDLSQLESNKFRLVNDEVSMMDIVHECLEIMQFKFRSKSLPLISKISSHLPRFKCDQNRYKQILLNLLSNAVKFTERGEVDVSLSYDFTNHLLVTTVKDTGIGIRNEEKGQLFSFFGKLESSASLNAQGSGLGLHICKKLSEAMGGYITLESEYAKGTTVTFSIKNQLEEILYGSNISISIPVEREQSEADLGPGMPISPTPFSSTISHTHSYSKAASILVVDDEPICGHAMFMYLKSMGHPADVVSFLKK